ncbi:carbon monoxide dehydrogenase subunit G [Alteribacillus sp. JSM 102045]|uniref:SRPBCC family protein n=1 Tax=Alteribacillus sp. JSM 102045 TaxID=1562101 RepID=UPI0035C1742A
MEGKGEIKLPGNKEEVFNQLMDPDVLEKCIMGCKDLEKMEENKYKADLSVGIASVKGKYDATITLTNVEEPNHYTLIVHGEGNPGIVDAEGNIHLESDGANETLLHYTYTADVKGKVASIGQRMLGGVAKLIINDFFKKAKKELQRQQSAS